MSYEKLIYELIDCLIKWGLWKSDAAFYYNGKEYSPYCEDDTPIESMGQNRVVISEDTREEAICYSEPPEKYLLYMTSNIDISDLFTYGLFGVDIANVPYSTKLLLLENNKELMDEFYSMIEDIDEFPQYYNDLPDRLDFNSEEEYQEYKDEYIEDLKKEYIEDLSADITVFKTPIIEISQIIQKYGLNYLYKGGTLFIGHNYL